MSASPREPASSPEKPGSEREDTDDPDCDGGVIECFRSYRVGGGEAEDNADEGDPHTSDDGDNFGHRAKIERSAFEVLGPDECHENWNAI